jgi:hypothetical protein
VLAVFNIQIYETIDFDSEICSLKHARGQCLTLVSFLFSMCECVQVQHRQATVSHRQRSCGSGTTLMCLVPTTDLVTNGRDSCLVFILLVLRY